MTTTYRLAALATVALSTATLAQGIRTRTFDVASIRPNQSKASPRIRVTDGRVEIINTPLWPTLLYAFHLKPYQLDGPRWIKEKRYDIQANIPDGVSREHVPEMLQMLLRERLGLKVRVEAKPLEVYELLVGAGGVRMQKAESLDERAVQILNGSDPGLSNALSDRVDDTFYGKKRTISATRVVRTVTAGTIYDKILTESGASVLDVTSITMKDFAEILSSNLDRPVLDRTELPGVYQFKVQLPRSQKSLRLVREAGIVPDSERYNTPEISIFKAVEALGLKLELRRVPIDHILIEQISPEPTPN